MTANCNVSKNSSSRIRLTYVSLYGLVVVPRINYRIGELGIEKKYKMSFAEAIQRFINIATSMARARQNQL